MKKSEKRENKTFLEDAMNQAVPIIVPMVVEMLIKAIPEGTRVDDFLRNYHQHWRKIANAVSMMVKTFTNAPDVVDNIIEEVSAESTKLIVERYGADGIIEKGKKSVKTGNGYRFLDLKIYLNADDDHLLNSNLLLLEESRRKKFLEYEVFVPLETAKTYLIMLARLESGRFVSWSAIHLPVTKPKEKSELEKGLEKGWKEFTEDVKKDNGKDGFFTRFAKKKGII